MRQTTLQKSSKSSLNSLALSDVDSTKIILKSVDDYCYGKQWMYYHIGSEKGEAISRFLRSSVESWRKKKAEEKRVYQLSWNKMTSWVLISSSLIMPRIYLSDLNDLEASGLLKAGCHVSEDNVVFLQAKGIVETRLD